MKTLFEKFASLFVALLMIFAFSTVAHASTANPEDMLLLPAEKEGKYAKLDVRSLPMDKEVTIRVRDEIDRLVYTFKVKNTGQKHVLVDFNRLMPGTYSLNVLRGDDDVVRKYLDIRWNEVAVREVISLKKDIGQEDRFPLNWLRSIN
ncbi:MAG: hypothetical protein JJU34_18250 [Lunatimonas sp.]|uniref:hypothetical protein n=1 Tax=Lunatimonas sp. TaxID=2060141 RepID=UPI00263B916A|nr:hypothetical protein [Lunatimonas sp.]MCC5939228.1 hypothetical protein [Lunatimonas sp.]